MDTRLRTGIGVAALAIGAMLVVAGCGESAKSKPKKGDVLDVDTPIPTAKAAAELVKQSDQLSRQANHNGVIDIATEGVRHLHTRTSSGTSKGDRPRSAMTELPTGSKQSYSYSYEYELTMDAKNFWNDVNRASDKNGFVTVPELTTHLKKQFGDELSPTELGQIKVEHPGLFTGPEDSEYNGSEHTVDARDANEAFLTELGLQDAKPYNSDVIDIKTLKPSRKNWGQDLNSSRPFFSSIDKKFGNSDDKVQPQELTKYVSSLLWKDAPTATKFLHSEVEKAANTLEPATIWTRVGEAQNRLGGALYYNTAIPQATVNELFGGSLETYLENHYGYAEQSGVKWQPKDLSASD